MKYEGHSIEGPDLSYLDSFIFNHADGMTALQKR